MPLAETGPEVYVSTMTKVISNYYASLEDNLIHFKGIKLKHHLGEDVTELCAAILVDADCIESARAFKPEHLGYITNIFENTFDPIFHFRSTHRYN